MPSIAFVPRGTQQSPSDCDVRQWNYTTGRSGVCQRTAEIPCKAWSEKIPRLFFRGVICRRRGLRRDRRNVNIFSGLCIAKLLARFFLNGLLIALQSLNLLCVAIIFLLHLIGLLL